MKLFTALWRKDLRSYEPIRPPQGHAFCNGSAQQHGDRMLHICTFRYFLPSLSIRSCLTDVAQARKSSESQPKRTQLEKLSQTTGWMEFIFFWGYLKQHISNWCVWHGHARSIDESDATGRWHRHAGGDVPVSMQQHVFLFPCQNGSSKINEIFCHMYTWDTSKRRSSDYFRLDQGVKGRLIVTFRRMWNLSSAFDPPLEGAVCSSGAALRNQSLGDITPPPVPTWVSSTKQIFKKKIKKN